LTPFAYRTRRTWVHRLPAGIKLCLYLGLSLMAFVWGPFALIPAFGLAVVGAFGSGIGLRGLFSGFKPLFITCLLVLAVRSVELDPLGFDAEGLYQALVFTATVAVAFSAGSVLFAATSAMELKNAIGGAENALTYPIRKVLHRIGSPWTERMALRLEMGGLSLGISLMLAFIPRIFETWEAAESAYLARLGKKGIRSARILIPLVAERMMETASDSALALLSRGAGGYGADTPGPGESGESSEPVRALNKRDSNSDESGEA
jgi:energy-coupling factor transporter transmembrane protein EcfT